MPMRQCEPNGMKRRAILSIRDKLAATIALAGADVTWRDILAHACACGR